MFFLKFCQSLIQAQPELFSPSEHLWELIDNFYIHISFTFNLAHEEMMYWPVAQEISFKDTSFFLALVAMWFSQAEHSYQFW